MKRFAFSAALMTGMTVEALQIHGHAAIRAPTLTNVAKKEEAAPVKKAAEPAPKKVETPVKKVEEPAKKPEESDKEEPTKEVLYEDKVMGDYAKKVRE